jgi:RNA polymerase sigma factor (sigma-70 family)
MRAIDFLEQINKIDTMIANKLEEIERWKTLATSTTAPINGDRVQSSGSQQKMADATLEYLTIEDDLKADIERLRKARRDIVEVIEQLPVKQYDILHKIYIQGLTFRQISEISGKSKGSIDSTKKKAIRNVQAILDRRDDDKKQGYMG